MTRETHPHDRSEPSPAPVRRPRGRTRPDARRRRRGIRRLRRAAEPRSARVDDRPRQAGRRERPPRERRGADPLRLGANGAAGQQPPRSRARPGSDRGRGRPGARVRDRRTGSTSALPRCRGDHGIPRDGRAARREWPGAAVCRRVDDAPGVAAGAHDDRHGLRPRLGLQALHLHHGGPAHRTGCRAARGAGRHLPAGVRRERQGGGHRPRAADPHLRLRLVAAVVERLLRHSCSHQSGHGPAARQPSRHGLSLQRPQPHQPGRDGRAADGTEPGRRRP